MPRYFFRPREIAVTIICLLLLTAGPSTVTAASDWKKTTECAISNDMPGFHRDRQVCWSLTEKGSTSIYAEDRIFESNRYWALAIVRLAGPFTVWRKSDPETVFKAASWWLEEQDAEMTCAPEKTVPIKLWVNRAKSWNLTTRDYGAGCFAFASTGGPPDAGNRQAYHFAAIICSKDSQEIPVDIRGDIATGFSVTHNFYNPPFRSE